MTESHNAPASVKAVIKTYSLQAILYTSLLR